MYLNSVDLNQAKETVDFLISNGIFNPDKLFSIMYIARCTFPVLEEDEGYEAGQQRTYDTAQLLYYILDKTMEHGSGDLSGVRLEIKNIHQAVLCLKYFASKGIDVNRVSSILHYNGKDVSEFEFFIKHFHELNQPRIKRLILPYAIPEPEKVAKNDRGKVISVV